MAEEVANTEQTFRDSILKVKRLDIAEKNQNVEKLRNKQNSGKKELATVMVSGLPEGSTENSVHIHFQKKKNGGGDIQKVEMLREGKARLTFEDPEGRCHCSSQNTSG